MGEAGSGVGGAGGGVGVAGLAMLAELVPRSQTRDQGHPAPLHWLRRTSQDLPFVRRGDGKCRVCVIIQLRRLARFGGVSMIYRVAVLSAVLLTVVGLAAPAYAANRAWIIKGGSCRGPITCDSVALGFIDGHVGVLFLNGSKIVIGFSGDLIGDDGPLFFPTAIRLEGGKEVPVPPGGHNNSCHFCFSDHGAFTPGWEHRLTSIECDSQGRDVMFGSGPYFNGPAVLSVVPNVVKETK